MAAPGGCPRCGTGLVGARCPTCGISLEGPTAQELARVDQDLARLVARRQDLIGRLGAEAPWQVQPTSALPPPPPPPPGELPPLFADQPATLDLTGRPAGPQVSSILLSLGTALLVVASLVFAAVTWNRIGPVGQGALLLGLTVAAAFATDRASRRGLTGTAEALGVLTVLMGPLVAQAMRITTGLVADVDLRTWANWGSWSWWPAAIVLIGAASLAFGQAVAVRSPQLLGAGLVQFGLPLWTALAPLPTVAKVGLLAVQAVLVGAALAPSARTTSTGSVWWAGSVVVWAWAVVAAATMIPGSDPLEAVRWPLVGALMSLAAAASAISWAWTDTPPRRDGPAAGALASVLAAIALVLAGSAPEVVAWPVAVVAFGVVLLAVDRLGGARRAALTPLAWTAVGLAALPVVAAVAAAFGAGTDAAEPIWSSYFGVVPDAVGSARAYGNTLSVTVSLVAVAAAVWLVAGREAGRSAAWAAGVAIVVTAPVLAGLSTGAITVVLLSAAAATAAVAVTVDRGAVVPAATLLAAGLLWSLSTQPLTIAALAVSAVAAIAAVVAFQRDEHEIPAAAATTVATTAVLVELGVLADAAGAGRPWPVAVVAVVAAVGLILVPSRADTMVPKAAVFVFSAFHLTMLLRLASDASYVAAGAGALTAVLAVGATAAAAKAFLVHREQRGLAWWGWAVVAGAEVLWLAWYRLTEASITVLEAYTLPLAVVVATVSVLAARATRPGGLRTTHSWMLEGGGLALALWPTALVALGDPGLTRQVVGLGGGAAVLTAGAAWRRRAPVDIGGATVALLGMQAALPYLADVPRWISLGAVGAALVLLGATFERRRQDLDEARRRYAMLH